jgi:hypothetical protein
MRIDATTSPEYRATILAIRSVPKTLQKMIRRETQRIAAPEWSKALAERAHTRVEQRVLVDTAVARVSNQNVKLMSASKGRPLSGGLDPKTDYAAVEFGADHGKTATYSRNRRGNRHEVTRHVSRGVPARRKAGPFYGSVRNMIPRIGALLAQTTVRTIATALEGKQE